MRLGIITGYIINAVCILIVITLYGFLTAAVSGLLGDKTPASEGMLTINPTRHIDPLGFIMFLFFGIGWGQPVKTSSYGYKNKKLGMVVTGLAPMAAMLVLGVLFILLYDIIGERLPYNSGIFIYTTGYTALKYAVINIIPVYPLSGNRVLMAFLSPNAVVSYSRVEGMIRIIFMFIIIFGILNRPINAVVNLILLNL